MPTPLTEFQRLIADAYEYGDFAHITTAEEADEVGDSLFAFLIRESGDAGDDPNELLNMMRRAESQVRDVADAVQSKYF